MRRKTSPTFRRRVKIYARPEIFAKVVIDGLRKFGPVEIDTLAGTPEDVRFKLPAEVSDA